MVGRRVGGSVGLVVGVRVDGALLGDGVGHAGVQHVHVTAEQSTAMAKLPSDAWHSVEGICPSKSSLPDKSNVCNAVKCLSSMGKESVKELLLRSSTRRRVRNRATSGGIPPRSRLLASDSCVTRRRDVVCSLSSNRRLVVVVSFSCANNSHVTPYHSQTGVLKLYHPVLLVH